MAKTSVYKKLAIYAHQSAIEIGQGREKKTMDTVLLTSIELLFRKTMQHSIPALQHLLNCS